MHLPECEVREFCHLAKIKVCAELWQSYVVKRQQWCADISDRLES